MKLKMKLNDVVKIWDLIQYKDIGELEFCDLQNAVDQVVGIEKECKPLTEST